MKIEKLRVKKNDYNHLYMKFSEITLQHHRMYILRKIIAKGKI
jgi:hypothetical protein